MTKNDVQKLLSGYRTATQKVDMLEAELDAWEQRRKKNLPFDVLMPMSKIVYNLKREVENADRHRAVVKQLIGFLGNAEYEVLWRRYILGQTWQKIMADTHYTEGRVHQLHRAGLKQIAKKMSPPQG